MAWFAALSRRVARRESLTIVAFGSSTTEGVGASSPAATYPSVLAQTLPDKLGVSKERVVVLNRGHGGDEARGMLNRIEADALNLAPDLVIWQTGSNDALIGVLLDRFEKDTRVAVSRLKDAGVDVMLMDSQWCPVLEKTPKEKEYREAVARVGAELDVVTLRRHDLMLQWLAEGRATPVELIGPDGLHMVDRGYALLAEAVAEEIVKNVCPKRTIEGLAESRS